MWGQQFKDLFAVVDAGKKKGLLKKSCAGSPYLHLFEAKKKQTKVRTDLESCLRLGC